VGSRGGFYKKSPWPPEAKERGYRVDRNEEKRDNNR